MSAKPVCPRCGGRDTERRGNKIYCNACEHVTWTDLTSTKHLYEVIVGNIGTVYSGHSLIAATSDYNTYVAHSRDNYGRAAGESVVLMHNGEPELEYTGTLEQKRLADEGL